MTTQDYTSHSAADLADFEAFIAMYGSKTSSEETDLQRWLRANPGHSYREGKKGEPYSIRMDPIDPSAPKAGIARARYVRQCATTYLAHTLHVDIRREAAHDPALVWNPLARRYRLRAAGDAPAGCASVGQADRTSDRRDTAPAPGDRSLDLIASAPDLGQRTPDAFEGGGGMKSFDAANLKTGAGLEF